MEVNLNVVNGLIEISVSQILTDVQMEKFENEKLRSKIEAISKDFQLNWSIDVKDNVATLITSMMTTSNISAEIISIARKNAVDFKTVVDKMEIPASDTPVAPKDMSDYEFIKLIVDKWDKTGVEGFVIVASKFGITRACGTIPESLAKELCMSYLKVHSND